jgi:hypothetical protein
MTEEWRDIPGYRGSYQVSDCGRVRSLDRVIACGRKWKGRILRQVPNQGGYLQVFLSRDSKPRNFAVHRLVACAFFGPCPQHCEVLHGAKGQKCNEAANLRYGTSKENSQDTIERGLTSARPVIRSDGKKYRSLTAAAEAVGCHNSHICMVCKGKHKTAYGFGWRYE